MAKPTDLPIWATDGGADVVEPSSAKKTTGWVANERPPAQYFNWWMEKVHDWVEYLDNLDTDADFLSPSYAWTGTHTWTAGPHSISVNGAAISQFAGTSRLNFLTGTRLDVQSGSFFSWSGGGEINGSVTVQGGALLLFDDSLGSATATFQGSGSALNINSSAKLNINATDGLAIKSGGDINVESGGDVKFEGGADLVMEGGSVAEWEVGSSLNLNDGVLINYVGTKPSRSIVMSPGHWINWSGSGDWSQTNQGHWDCVASSSSTLLMPIRLPHGAILQEWEVMVQQSTAGGTKKARLYKRDSTWTGTEAVGTWDIIGTAASVATETIVQAFGNSGVGETIDGQTEYWIEFDPDGGAGTTDLYGVRLTYDDPGPRNH